MFSLQRHLKRLNTEYFKSYLAHFQPSRLESIRERVKNLPENHRDRRQNEAQLDKINEIKNVILERERAVRKLAGTKWL